MRSVLFPCLLTMTLLSGVAAGAPSRAQLIERADVVVTASPQATYARAKRYLLEVRVEHVEKGSGPSVGALLYVRASTAPAGDDSQRLFLRRSRDGGYALLGAEPAAAGKPVPLRPGTLKGLERALKQTAATLKAGDMKLFSRQLKAFHLPKPERWFARVFGKQATPGLAAEYAAALPKLAPRMRKALQGGLDSKRGLRLVAYRAEGHRAIGVQRRAAFAMQRKVQLYGVRVVGSGKRPLWSFAHVDGRFRWVGKLRALPSREPLVVRVEFSSDPLDPSQAKDHTLRVVIANKSTKSVAQVPTIYDDASVVLKGRGMSHMWPLRLRRADRVRQVWKPLAPGKERVLLEARLSDLFAPTPRGRWSWDWGAHPVPPLTPVHRYRADGHEASAVFLLSVEAGRRRLHSKPTRLRIKGD